MEEEIRDARWDERYMEMAQLVSTWSKDPGTKIGAVVVGKHGQILSTGYNGFPRKIWDTPERLLLREDKLKYTIHAEQNCIYNASLTGISLEGSTMYVAGLPVCADCAKAIIQSGISEVVVQEAVLDHERWMESWAISKEMFAESGVDVWVVSDEEEPVG